MPNTEILHIRHLIFPITLLLISFAANKLSEAMMSPSNLSTTSAGILLFILSHEV